MKVRVLRLWLFSGVILASFMSRADDKFSECSSHKLFKSGILNQEMSDSVICNKGGLFFKNVLSSQSLILNKESLLDEVREKFNFVGLASYYQNTQPFTIKEGVYTELALNTNESSKMVMKNWGLKGRFKGIIILSNKDISVVDEGLSWRVSSTETVNMRLFLGSLKEVSKVSKEVPNLKYTHMFAPIRWLCFAIEELFLFIGETFQKNWGLAVIILALVLKLLLLPVSLLTEKFQKQVADVDKILAPQLKEIKSKYDGEEAHRRIMAAHKDLSVSPFYTMKPILASLIQIPVLVAVFNVLGETQELVTASFLWIQSLAYPDHIFHLGFFIPYMGEHFNLLPFLMTAVTLISTLLFKNKNATKEFESSQKRNVYLMGVVFFLLFYTFPSGMVLYWTMTNLYQFTERRVFKLGQ